MKNDLTITIRNVEDSDVDAIVDATTNYLDEIGMHLRDISAHYTTTDDDDAKQKSLDRLVLCDACFDNIHGVK